MKMTWMVFSVVCTLSVSAFGQPWDGNGVEGDLDPRVEPHVSAGYAHTVGLKTDGTVVAVGLNNYGQCNVGGWTDIRQVSAGLVHTVGLKTDGMVVAMGASANGECNVGGWTDIVQVSAGGDHTVGLKTDGTVVAVGNNTFGRCEVSGWDLDPDVGVLSVDIDIGELWMYQNLPGQINSNLIADVLITDDPLSNSSYTYEWEIILPDDVTMAPTITAGGGFSDPCCTFAAPSCNEPDGLSDSGETFTVRVTVTGDDYGNTGTAQAQFGIALLGDANNDGVVNVADRSIINAFWRLGAAGPFTFNDCNVNGDTAVNVADRSIANAIWRGVLGQNSVSAPCPFR